MWAFNEEIVARAVYDSLLPVVSGVGHETDFTICDFVADVRAPTPTAAAALVVRERTALRGQLADGWRRLVRANAHHASSRAQRLDAAARRLVHPAARLAQQEQRMRALGTRLARAFHHGRALHARRLAAVRARLIREVRSPLPQASRLLQASRMFKRARDDRLERASRVLHRLGDALALLNPGAVLERGYSIVAANDGTIVADARQLSIGATVALTFAKGRAAATVDATTHDAD